jgi:phosphoglycerol transferase MdoB-like AlkP superfamily enzyme
MKKLLNNYKMYFIVIIYLIVLRFVLFFTTGLKLYPVGLVFDVIVMMFWVGVLIYFIHSLFWQKVYYFLVIIMSSLFVIVDSVYYDYFGVLFAKSGLSGIKWLQGGNTLEYHITIPLIAYIITPLLIVVLYLIGSVKKRDQFQFRHFAVVLGLFVAQSTLFVFWGNQQFESRIAYYRSDAYLFESMYDRVRFSEKYGYYNYHILDLTRLHKAPDVSEDVAEINDYFENQSDHQKNAYSDIYKGYNVVMIVSETLETRFINETLTPNLYMMTENGMTFDNYFTTVFQQGATCNSEYMGMSGLEAIRSNDWSSNICDAYSNNANPYALPNQLKEAGYDTYYFHSGHEWFYNREVMIPHYGFDTVKFQEDLINDGYTDFYDRFDTQMIDFLDEYMTYDEPFMMTLLTYSMHGAYNQEEFEKNADQLEAAYPGQDFDPEIRNYMLKLIEYDRLLGLLMDRLEEHGELDKTLFVIYPDHYPYMMNFNSYSSFIGISDLHEIARQKLTIYTPSMTKQVIHTTGSQIDITPTILNMVNSDGDFHYFMGKDLMSNEQNYVIFPDLTITDGQNFLNLDQTFIGDRNEYNNLETELENRILMFEIQKKLLNSDFFAHNQD